MSGEGEKSQRVEFLGDLAAAVDGEPEALRRHGDLIEHNRGVAELLQESRRLSQAVAKAGGDFRPNPELISHLRSIMAGQQRNVPKSLPPPPVAVEGVRRSQAPEAPPEKRRASRSPGALASSAPALREPARPQNRSSGSSATKWLLVLLALLLAVGAGVAAFSLGLLPVGETEGSERASQDAPSCRPLRPACIRMSAV